MTTRQLPSLLDLLQRAKQRSLAEPALLNTIPVDQQEKVEALFFKLSDYDLTSTNFPYRAHVAMPWNRKHVIVETRNVAQVKSVLAARLSREEFKLLHFHLVSALDGHFIRR